MVDSYGRAVVACLLLLAARLSAAGQPDETLFDDGFELPNRFVDVATTTFAVCAIDVVGNLRCAMRPGSSAYPEFVESDFIDLAGTEGGVCARDASDAIQCFGPDPLVPDAAFAAAIAGTTGFLPDFGTRICAPNTSGSTIECFGGGPPAGTNVTDFAAAGAFEDSETVCWTPTTGGIVCDTGSGPVTYAAGSLFIDAALAGNGAGYEAVCGVSGASAPVCFHTLTGQPEPLRGSVRGGLDAIHGQQNGSFCGLDNNEGELVCWTTASSPVSGASGFQNRGTPARLASIETFLDGGTCAIDRSQQVECWGLVFAGAGLAPRGGGWTGVHSAGGSVAWSRPDRPARLAGMNSDQTRSGAGFAPLGNVFLSGALVECSLKDGEFRCIDGTDRWGVPEGPWRDVAVTAGFTEAWCGIREDGSLVCNSVSAASQLESVPPGAFTQLALSFDWFNPMPEERAVALGEDGSLACWSTSGACGVPAGTDFVRLSDDTLGGQFALRDNGEVVDLLSGSTTAGETFPRYSGPFGFRADDTIAWWADPGRPVPPGAYRDAVAISTIVPGPGPASVAVDACAIRLDGGVDCWRDDPGGAVVVHQVDGDYRTATAGLGLMLNTASGDSDTSAILDFGITLSPAGEIVTSFSTHCMVDADGTLGCRQLGLDETAPVNTAGGPYRALSLYQSTLCALDAADRVDCWDFDGGTPPSFSDQPFQDVAVGFGHACGVTETGTLVECTGGNGLNPLPPNPFPQLISGAYRDLATSAYATCIIDPDGLVDCVSPSWLITDLPDPSARYDRIEIDAFSNRFCLIEESGALECFERGSGGQPLNPVFSAPGPFTDVAQFSGGICALTPGGSGRCWSVETELEAWRIEAPRI